MKEKYRAAWFARLGFSETPPTLTAGTDTTSVDWINECMAWFLVKTMAPREIALWVDEHKKKRPDYTKNVLDKINRFRRMIKQKEQQHESE